MKSFPTAVYRLQLSENFTLKQATQILPYLTKLGIEGVYCSPYFAAYSPHGYDIVDPNRINPLLATPKEYEAFCKSLKKHNLFHIADVVPNHMGIRGKNLWWQDVLEKGKDSKFAHFFDIYWNKTPISLPVLDATSKEKPKRVEKNKKPYLQYGDQLYPIPLGAPTYRFVDWRESALETSYRRFFNINELIGIRIEDEGVFKAHHKWLFQLLKEKKIDGLRIDHPDGLYDPAEYFQRLRQKHKGLIIVEKILGWGEELPPAWEVEGSVGYEYMNILTGLFVKKDEALTRIYESFIGQRQDFEKMLYEKKKNYLLAEMKGDVTNLCERLLSFSSKIPPYNNLEEEAIFDALVELLASFPVYRSYIKPKGGIPKRNLPYLRAAFAKAHIHGTHVKKGAFSLLEEILFLKLDTPYLRDFIMRFQQLSAPIMAKGFEDITLYNYNRLLALNEVGSEPSRFGVSSEEFHRFFKRKQEKWPFGLISTSTHDTKRSMDVRMQIAVLSEIPEKWEKALQIWSKQNKKHKTKIDGKLFPEPNAEYFLYQTLLGVWPSKPSVKRIWQAYQKSLREARSHTNWREPNLPYEKAAENFLKALMKKQTPFYRSFTKFQKEIEPYGRLNTLSATALKLGGPGIIDIYEGCENWRFTLVDPDNRTPVKYPKAIKKEVKAQLHMRALQFRKDHKELFLEGRYIPLEIKGPGKDHIIAYLRVQGKETCLVAAIRYFSQLKSLKKAMIQLSKKLGRGVDIFSGDTIEIESDQLPASSLFKENPFVWVFFNN